MHDLPLAFVGSHGLRIAIRKIQLRAPGSEQAVGAGSHRGQVELSIRRNPELLELPGAVGRRNAIDRGWWGRESRGESRAGCAGLDRNARYRAVQFRRVVAHGDLDGR